MRPGWESEQQTADVIAGVWFTRAKGDAQKVTTAVRLRAETAMTVKWIAQRLQMGGPGHVNHLH